MVWGELSISSYVMWSGASGGATWSRSAIRPASRVAAQLHRLADRLEGRGESHVPSPMFEPQDI